MNILIVFCHPEPSSFNAALKNSAIEVFESSGHTVDIYDLYGEGFDPVERESHYKNRLISERFEPLSEQRNASSMDTLPEDVSREIERLKKCDLIIFQFPMWWHQQPAMLKGWCDRVFVAGGFYTSKMRYSNGFFKGKRAICSVTSGAPISTFTERGRAGGIIETLLQPLNYSLHYITWGSLCFVPNFSLKYRGQGLRTGLRRNSRNISVHVLKNGRIS